MIKVCIPRLLANGTTCQEQDQEMFFERGDLLNNSSLPSAAYMRQWTGSACSVPSHYLNQYRLIVNLTLRNKLQWNSNLNTKLLIPENAFKNVVCEMASILSRERWVKYYYYPSE